MYHTKVKEVKAYLLKLALLLIQILVGGGEVVVAVARVFPRHVDVEGLRLEDCEEAVGVMLLMIAHEQLAPSNNQIAFIERDQFTSSLLIHGNCGSLAQRNYVYASDTFSLQPLRLTLCI